MSKRLHGFDFIRTTAALAVIAIHVTASYMDLSLGYLWNHVVRFAVPLFIVISGFLLYYADREANTMPARFFYTKRLHRVLWPYCLWTLLYSLLNAYFLGLNNPTVFFNGFSRDLLWGTAYYHLWFVPIIVQLYLLFPLLRRWMVKSPRGLLIGSLTISLAAQGLIYLYMLHVVALPGQYSLLYVRAFPVWLFYFVFGMFMARKLVGPSGSEDYDSLDTPNPSLMPVPLPRSAFFWLGSLGLMLLDSRLAGQGSIVRPSVMLYAISSYFLFNRLAMRFSRGERPWLTWLSAQSFLIYLMHPLLLTLLVYSATKIGHPGLWAGNRGVLGLYFFTTILTVIGTYVLSLTPMASWLGGVKQKKL